MHAPCGRSSPGILERTDRAMLAKHTNHCTGPRQAALGELIGLQAITDALADVIRFRPDNARWLAVGVRGHRIAGRRLGHCQWRRVSADSWRRPESVRLSLVLSLAA